MFSDFTGFIMNTGGGGGGGLQKFFGGGGGGGGRGDYRYQHCQEIDLNF